MKAYQRSNLKRNIRETFELLNTCIDEIYDIEKTTKENFSDYTDNATDDVKLDAIREMCYKHSMYMSELIYRVERNVEALVKNTMSKTSKQMLNRYVHERLNRETSQNEYVKYAYCLTNYSQKQLKQCIRNDILTDLDNDYII